MDIRPYRKIKRRKTKKIKVGNVEVGGDSKIAIQSMTNTITSDAKSTISQILTVDFLRKAMIEKTSSIILPARRV